MNWNDNDTKYIIKRIILYILIMGIVFFAGQRCAKATVTSLYMCSLNNQNMNCDLYFNQNDLSKHMTFYNLSGTSNYRPFNNYGQGYVNFSILAQYGQGLHSNSYLGVYAVYIRSYISSSNSYGVFTCDIGTVGAYKDNTTQYEIYSVKCPVDFTGAYAYDIQIDKYGSSEMYIKRSEVITYTSDLDTSNAIVSAQQSAANSQITAIQNQASETRVHIDEAANDIINAVDSSTQAITDNTQAINDLNDNIMQDYNGPSQELTDSIFSFEHLFSSEDSDIIRGILLFPIRLFAIILSAIDRSTCVTYSFGTLFGYELRLPCITYSDYLGSIIYSFIDWTFALAITFGLIRYIISLYDFVFSVGLKGAAVVAAVEVFK